MVLLQLMAVAALAEEPAASLRIIPLAIDSW
eukprot:SAG31_NODE_36408_length_313_cov_1.275701_1_plen_30_part_01